MHLVVTCNDQDYFAEPKCVTYIEGDATAAAVDLDIGGVKL